MSLTNETSLNPCDKLSVPSRAAVGVVIVRHCEGASWDMW
jgi:hypothetical protein